MSFEHSVQRVMSGAARGPGASAARAALAAAEPVYRAAVGWRNRRFDRDPARARRLPRPVVSVGNLTTGGTGKTPVIRWLAGQLRRRGLAVAVLSRGYKAAPGTLGDEQRMLLALLGDEAGGGSGAAVRDAAHDDGPPVTIEADPDRFVAGVRVLAQSPGVDVFLLDDGFQHRRLHRDLDVVLLHAGEPFGYGHLLPRGLLREPVASLGRAGAVVLTHAGPAGDGGVGDEGVSSGGVGDSSPGDASPGDGGPGGGPWAAVTAEVRRWNPACPVVREWHEPAGFRSADVPSHRPADHPPTALAVRRAFCFSGLAAPQGFESQVRAAAGHYCGQLRFPDHHAYTPADLRAARAAAERAGADVLVTTEKDWVKIDFPADAGPDALPIWRADVVARFAAGDDARLLDLVVAAINRHPRA
jgi:tetraacyldisaccharide 4'-kinase